MSWNDKEDCKFCGGPAPCYTHCSESPDGKHVADPETVSNRQERDPFLFDINCKLCGQSGSFMIEQPELDEITAWD